MGREGSANQKNLLSDLPTPMAHKSGGSKEKHTKPGDWDLKTRYASMKTTKTYYYFVSE